MRRKLVSPSVFKGILAGVLLSGLAFAASTYVDIIPEPSQSERIGDGIGQFLAGEADGKFSGPSEMRKLKKVLALANWKETEIEKLITRGRLTDGEAKAVVAQVKALTTREVTWFLAEIKNSPVAKACGY